MKGSFNKGQESRNIPNRQRSEFPQAKRDPHLQPTLSLPPSRMRAIKEVSAGSQFPVSNQDVRDNVRL